MDENYPIDIHYNKLLDWLIDRRHVSSKWHLQFKAITSQVSLATEKLPSDNPEIAKILSKDVLNYFDCGEIVEILKVLDGESKSLFGQYTAPRVKEWADVMKSYENGRVYLAESGQHLARMVNYELPSLKHQINRSQQIIRESRRKEEEFKRTASALKEKFKASCKEMGIKGAKVSRELGDLVNELPVIYDEVLNNLPKLLQPIVFYQTFLHSILGRTIEEDRFLPMLSFILKNGNVTVYQWRHGKAPNIDQNQKSENRNETGELDIDWGSGNGETDDGIDFGGINFGDIDFGCVSSSVEDEIDLSCIKLEESGDGGVAHREDQGMEEVGVVGDGGVAHQEDQGREEVGVVGTGGDGGVAHQEDQGREEVDVVGGVAHPEDQGREEVGVVGDGGVAHQEDRGREEVGVVGTGGDGGVAHQEEVGVVGDGGMAHQEEVGVVGDGGVAHQEEVGVVGTSGDGGVAHQEDQGREEVDLCLDAPVTRNLLLDDLFELKEFLTQRLHELSLDDITTMQSFSFDDLESNTDSVFDMLSYVTKVLELLTNKRIQHLFLIKGSQRYLERLADKLVQDLRLSNKAGNQAIEVVLRREQAILSLTYLQPKYEEGVVYTKKLQKQLSGEISKLYDQRHVNIMGEINQI